MSQEILNEITERFTQAIQTENKVNRVEKLIFVERETSSADIPQHIKSRILERCREHRMASLDLAILDADGYRE